MKPQVSDAKIKHAITLLSDLHIGSIWGIAKTYITHDGRQIKPSPQQQHLYQSLQKAKKTMTYWNTDTIILLGDLIQGSNIREFGRRLSISDLEEQQDMAIQILKPICQNLNVIGISGTRYHKSLDTEIEKRIIDALNGKFYEKMAWITIPNSKRTLNIAHELTTARQYPISAFDREATFMQKAYAEGKLPHKPDIIIRGHIHKFAHIHTPDYHAIYVPSFMCWGDYTTKWYGAVQPDIGIAILFIDQKDRVIVHHYTYPLPHLADKTVKLK